MKRYRLIGIIALALSLAIFSFILYQSSRKARVIQKIEPKYEHMTLIGTQQGSYQYSTACQAADSTYMIASVLTPEASQAEKLSIIRLSAKGELIWEKTFALEKKSILDFLKRNKTDQSLRILQISFYQNSYYLVLTQTDKLSDKQELPFILQISPEGELLSSKQIELNLLKGTSVQTYVNGDKLYLSYLNNKDKMLILSQIDLLTAEVLHTFVRFIRQRNLVINAVAADPADSVVSIVAYDKNMGCSFFQYTPKTELKEIFRTQPSSDIKLLKYSNDTLYSVVKEDSLLEIIDLTDLMKPLIKVTDIPSAKDFRIIDLLIINDKFHVLVKTETVKNTGEKEIKAELLSYNSDGSKAGVTTIESSEFEYEKQLIGLGDERLMILGKISGKAESNAARLFIKKIIQSSGTDNPVREKQ